MDILSDIFEAYRTRAHAAIAGSPKGIWLDAGGGRVCEFGHLLSPEEAERGVVLDNSHADLLRNFLITRRVKCDLDQPLPIADNSVEFVFSSRMLEHLQHPAGFISESYRVLRPSGKLTVAIPTGRAPFSIIKRLLPHEVSRRLVARFAENREQLCWAKLFYRNCTPCALTEMCRHVGFEIEYIAISFRQAQHFRRLLIAYWPLSWYDRLAERSGLSGLAAYVLVCVQKPKVQNS